MDRRTLLKSAAWAVPVVTVATAAPAFATSTNVSACIVTGWYKDPGLGHATKDYYVLVDCQDGTKVFSVQIKDDVAGEWLTAEKQEDGSWAAFGFNDSRRNRMVLVNGTEVFNVAFPPMNG